MKWREDILRAGAAQRGTGRRALPHGARSDSRSAATGPSPQCHDDLHAVELARLGWTIATLALAIAPHARHLPPWALAIALALAIWRLHIAWRGTGLPSRWLRLLLAVGAAITVIGTFHTLNGLDAGTALLVLMAALKLLETHTPRDHVIVVFIAWFLCIATFFYDQSIVSIAWVIPGVWLGAAALLRVSRTGADGPPQRPLRDTGAMLLRALPFVLVLFLFFPRLEGRFWSLPADDKAISGLDGEMAPGDLTELTLVDTVAFRVRFHGAMPPPAQRYWRGPVLTDFDGFTWRRPEFMTVPNSGVDLHGDAYDYTVTLEPHRRQWVFALDLPASWDDASIRQQADFMLTTRQPVGAVYTYGVRSHTRYRVTGTLPVTMRRQNLRLPAGRNPRAAALAADLRARVDSDEAFVATVLAIFRDQQFFYTLEPPRLERDSVDDFLFNTRRGFCGHFASAFTNMARAAGIPARVVTGYQGGDYNALGGHLIVRQSHAHAWSEVWFESGGWVRVDPTAAVAPERVERGLSAALPAGEPVPGRALREHAWLWQARMVVDAVNARWNDWVVKFGPERQNRLFRRLGLDRPGWREFGLVLGVGLGLALALLAVWLAVEFRGPRPDAPSRAYATFLRKLARRGIERAPHEGPQDFLRRLVHQRPELALPAREITELYVRLRYLPAPDAAALAALRTASRRFRA
jgi:transglutaminase-like putative cysteine protease